MDPRGELILLIASQEQQQLLLELSKLDSTIARTQSSLHAIEGDESISHLRSQLLEGSERLLQAHAKQENLKLEIKKLSTDLEMVENRIKHDADRAKQVSNEREQKAIDQELSSLAVRKSSLEDAELNLMEELETATKSVATLTQERASRNLELEQELSKQHGEALTLSASITELSGKRTAVFEKLDAELAKLYERKAQRGVAVAQTLGRDCSACRLAINAVEFESMMAEPADHLPSCPNCDALIVR